MKLVNEKGKLFGIINVVDLLILIAVIAVVGAVGYKYLSAPVTEAVAPKSEMTVVMRVRGSMPYLTSELLKLSPGERLVAGNDYVDAELVSVSAIPYRVQVQTADGKIRDTEDPVRSDIMLTVKSTANPNSPILKIGPQEIRIGRSFIFKTKTTEISAIIETVSFNG